MKKAIIYDLDHTLFDPHTLNKGIFDPAFEVLEKTKLFSQSEIQQIKLDFFTISFNDLLDKHFNNSSKDFFIETLRNLNFSDKLQPYNDSQKILEFDVTNYLVTTGLKEFQSLKIDNLRIKEWFSDIYIHDPFDGKWKDKEEIIRFILEKHQYKVSEVLVVGDNPESEIKAGNNIGIDTIQILRKGIAPSEKAIYRIKGIHELRNYIF